MTAVCCVEHLLGAGPGPAVCSGSRPQLTVTVRSGHCVVSIAQMWKPSLMEGKSLAQGLIVWSVAETEFVPSLGPESMLLTAILPAS